jgi:hypothetical protein
MEHYYLCNNIVDLLKIVIPALIILLSGYFGYRFGIKHFKYQKEIEFIEKQLREFYSPLIGYRFKIESISKNRVEIFKANDESWKEFCQTHPKPTDEDFKPFENSLKYDNKQFVEEIIPIYDKMISLMQENNYLAEPETIKHFYELYKFVDIWHRSLDNAIPKEALQKLEHTEEKLKPFYNDLEKQQKKLRDILSFKKK